MNKLFRSHQAEMALLCVILLMCTGLSLASDSFLTLANFTSLINNNAVNVIWAVGLLVVLIAGGIDISFAVAASIVQYLCVYLFASIGGNWLLGFIAAGTIGAGLGLINAFFIHKFRITSIVVTIATFNAFFGLLMYFSGGRFLFNLPAWWSSRIIFWEHQSATGQWAELTLPTVVMVFAVAATWAMLRYTTTGFQIFAFGDNPEGARRAGVNIGLIQAVAFGWLGMMAGIGGLMQAHIVQEVVPNALIGRELEVLSAVVLGGARLGGGRGSVLGCVLGVFLIAITENGLNLLGVSPFAFQMVIGAIIMIAISASSFDLSSLTSKPRTERS